MRGLNTAYVVAYEPDVDMDESERTHWVVEWPDGAISLRPIDPPPDKSLATVTVTGEAMRDDYLDRYFDDRQWMVVNK